MGSDPSEFLGVNPFPATLELQLHSDYANRDSLRWIAAELKKNEKVADVAYQVDLMDSVNRNLAKLNLLLLALAVLLTFVSFSLINNTVRLSVYARRHSIHTMRLVGASWAFIQRPFLSRSLGIGITAAVLAIAMLLGGVLWARKQDFFIQELISTPIIIWMVITVLTSALLLSVVCTWLSVNHFLNMRENELYK
jgi:cell division transport system permease protein